MFGKRNQRQAEQHEKDRQLAMEAGPGKAAPDGTIPTVSTVTNPVLRLRMRRWLRHRIHS